MGNTSNMFHQQVGAQLLFQDSLGRHEQLTSKNLFTCCDKKLRRWKTISLEHYGKRR